MRGHDRQQHLGGADVGGRLLAPDVLLAGLQCHTQGRCPVHIPGDADQAPGKLTLVGFMGGEERRVGTAVSQGYPKALGRAHGHVRPELTRWPQEGQGEQIAGHHQESPGVVQAPGEILQVLHPTSGAGVLDQDPEGALEVGRLVVPPR